MSKPGLVSCLMVTRSSRHRMAHQAIACFQQQSHGEKELLIVSDDPMSEMVVEIPGARFVLASPGMSLGELRNLSVEKADGEFVCQWDDDDWYHPRRIQRQLAHLLEAPKADGCVLGRWLMHWPARKAAAICGEADMAGSLLAYKDRMVKYYPRGKGEDNAIYVMNLVRLLEPWLYTYNIHGDNTYDAEHFENLFHAAGVDVAGRS